MTSYNELMAQAQDLMRQAEQARKAELSQVVADIKAQMAKYGITVADLGGSGGRRAKSSPSKSEAKYRGPNGELWAGGAGRKPQWVRDALAQGMDVESFRI